MNHWFKVELTIFNPVFVYTKNNILLEFTGGVLYLTPLNSKTLERVI